MVHERVHMLGPSSAVATDRMGHSTQEVGPSLFTLRLILVLGVVFYIVSLVWVYVNVVVPRYSYRGYSYESPGIAGFVVYWLMALAPSCWMPIGVRRPSQVALWILYLMVLVPVSVIAPLSMQITEKGGFFFFLVVLHVLFVLLGRVPHMAVFRMPRLTMSRGRFWIIIALLSIVSYALIISVFGLSLRLVPLEEVYSVRAQYKETLSEYSRLVPYAVSWQQKVICPLLIGLGLLFKNPALLVAGIIGEILVYSITGLKGAFFLGAFMFLLVIALHGRARYFGLFAVYGGLGLIALGIVQHLLLESSFILNLFVRRKMMVPGLNTGYYYDFFSTHPKALLGHSIFSAFVDYPYDAAPPMVIGRTYFWSATPHSNCNLWADAYANFGYVGMLVFTVLLGMVLIAFDSAARGGSFKLVCLMMAVAALSLAEAGLLTCMLTHGIGLSLLILLMLPRSRGGHVRKDALCRTARRRNGRELDGERGAEP